MQFLMLEKGLYQDLAKINAEAINGLQPKSTFYYITVVSVWNTGTGGEGSGFDAGKPIRDIFQCLPPLLSTIQEQTGMNPPAWLGSLPNDSKATL
jgi:flotillin